MTAARVEAGISEEALNAELRSLQQQARDRRRHPPAEHNGDRNGDGSNSDGGDGPPNRRLLFTPASKITPRPITWVWDTTPPGAGPAELQGRFPAGSLVLAVGRAGLGKSQFATWMTAQVTNGTLPGCYHRSPQSVVYCAAEDSWEMTIVPRLLAASADLDRVFHVRVADDGDPHARLTLPADTSCLEAGLATHQVVLVVLDPLLSMLDAQINDYRAREVRQALEPVVAVADRTRCLFLGLAHFTKATGTDPLLLVSGSGAFGQLIRAGVGFARDEQSSQPTDPDEGEGGGGGGAGGAFVLSQIKNNLGREELPSLQYVIEPKAVETPEGLSHVSRFHFTGRQSQRSVRDLLRGSGEDAEERSEREEAAEWLRDLLDDAGGALPAKEVKAAARSVGIAERTLDRARARAGVTSKRDGFGKDAVYLWRLACTPHARHVRQHTEGGAHGEHGGEHGAGTPRPRPEGDTKTTTTTRPDVLPSSPSLSPSGDGSGRGAAGGFAWSMEAEPVGPCAVCTQACYSRGPDRRPVHPGCWTRGTPPGIADSGGTPDPGLGAGATGAADDPTVRTGTAAPRTAGTADTHPARSQRSPDGRP